MPQGLADGALSYKALLDSSQFKAATRQMEQQVRGVSSTTQREGDKMNAVFKRIQTYAAGAFTIVAAKQFVNQLIEVRGEFQQLGIAFETMLGSKAKADALMSQIMQTAAVTPFNLTEVANGAKQLLAYGVAADQVNDTLVRLGNIASGLSIPLNDLTYLYGTTKVQGRLYAMDVRQFMGRGIPLVQKLAEQMGKTTDEINDMVSAGKIGFPEVEKVIKSMTDAGGMFFNLMEKQSKSLSGQMSNMGDAFERAFNRMGESSEGVLSSGIELATDLADNLEEVARVVGTLVVSYGAYKAAVMVSNVVGRISAQVTLLQAGSVEGLTAAQARNIIVRRNLSKAQLSLNAAMEANPIGIIIAALAALYLAYKHTEDGIQEVVTAQEMLKKVNDAVNDSVDAQKGKIKSLINVLENKHASDKQQQEALAKLRDISPDIVAGYDAQKDSIKKLKDNVDAYIDSLRKMLKQQALSDQMVEAYKQQQAAQRNLESIFKKLHPNQDIVTQLALQRGRELDAAMGGFRGTRAGQTLAELSLGTGLMGKYQNALIQYYRTTNAVEGLEKEQSKLIKTQGEETEATKKQITVGEHLSELKTELAKKEELLRQARLKGSLYSADNIKDLEDATKSIRQQIEQIRPGYFNQKEQPTVTVKPKVKLIPEIDTVDVQKMSTDGKKAIEDGLKDWLTYANDFGAQFKELITIPMDASLKELKANIAKIDQVLKDGFFMAKSGDKAILSPDQIAILRRVKEGLERVSKTGAEVYRQAQQIAQGFNDISQAVGGIAPGLSNVLSLLGSMTGGMAKFGAQIQKAQEAFTSFKNNKGGLGDLFGGIGAGLSAAAGVGTAFFSVISFIQKLEAAAEKRQKEAANRRAEQIKRENDLLREQLDLIRSYEIGEKRIEDIKAQQLALAKQIRKQSEGDVKSILAPSARLSPGMSREERQEVKRTFRKAAADYKTLYGKYSAAIDDGDYVLALKYYKQLVAIREEQGNLSEDEKAALEGNEKNIVKQIESIRQYNEELTGISFDSLTDKITQMFADGKTSAADFADTFEDLMRTAIIQSFKTKYLEKQLEGFYEQFADDVESGGKLTEAEIAARRKQLKQIMDDAGKNLDMLYDIAGIDPNSVANANNLSSAIKGITENTANVLSGQMTAIRVNQAESLDLVRSQLSKLSEISMNTRFLISIDRRLASLTGGGNDLRAGGISDTGKLIQTNYRFQ